jgi:hypothetical protein
MAGPTTPRGEATPYPAGTPTQPGGDIGGVEHGRANRAALASLPKAPELVDHRAVNQAEARLQRLARQQEAHNSRAGVGMPAART